MNNKSFVLDIGCHSESLAERSICCSLSVGFEAFNFRRSLL